MTSSQLHGDVLFSQVLHACLPLFAVDTSITNLDTPTKTDSNN